MAFYIEFSLFASPLSSHKLHCSWFEREERTSVNAFMPTGNSQRGLSWEPRGMWVCIQMTLDLTQYYVLVFSWEHQGIPWFRELIPIWNVCHSTRVKIWAKQCIWIWTCSVVSCDLKHCQSSVHNKHLSEPCISLMWNSSSINVLLKSYTRILCYWLQRKTERHTLNTWELHTSRLSSSSESKNLHRNTHLIARRYTTSVNNMCSKIGYFPQHT